MEYIFIIPIILMSIIVHEVSHGYVAYLLGDDTAKRYRRLSLHPMKHIDTFGTIILPLLLLLTSGGRLAFGYAKPVPINPYNFKDYKKGTAYTAAAGPLSNFIIAFVVAMIFRLLAALFFDPFTGGAPLAMFTLQILYATILFNMIIGLFNLIPIPPLDGSKVIGLFLSDEMYYKYTAQEQKGMMILMGIILISFVFNLNILGRVLFPPLRFFMQLLTGVAF